MIFFYKTALLLVSSLVISQALQFDPDYLRACALAHNDCLFEFLFVEPRPFFGMLGSSRFPFTTSIVAKEKDVKVGNLNMGRELPMRVVPSNKTLEYNQIRVSISYNLIPFTEDLIFTCPSDTPFETSLCHRQLRPTELDGLPGHCIRIQFEQYDVSYSNGSKYTENVKSDGKKFCVVFRTA